MQTSMRFWLGRKLKSVLRKAAGLVVAIAMMQSAQATASPNAPKESTYALVPAGSRMAAPDFTVTDLNGGTLALSQFKSKVVLLDFWAVDCGGCKVEIPW